MNRVTTTSAEYVIFSDVHILKKEDLRLFRLVIEYGLSINAEVYFLGDVGVTKFEEPTLEAIELVNKPMYKERVHMLKGNHAQMMRTLYDILKLENKVPKHTEARIEAALSVLEHYPQDVVTPYFYAVHDAFGGVIGDLTGVPLSLANILMIETFRVISKQRLQLNHLAVSGSDEFVEGNNVASLKELEKLEYATVLGKTNCELLGKLYQKLTDLNVDLSFFAGHEHNIDKDTTFFFRKFNDEIKWAYLTAGDSILLKEGLKIVMVCPNCRGLYKIPDYSLVEKHAHILEFDPSERKITYKKI